MEKYIFLDFDGVITTQKSHYRLDQDAINKLGKIIEETDAKIVVTSSWRMNSVEATKKELSTISSHVPFPFPFVDRIVGVTIRAYHYIKGDIHLDIPRGVEIKQWIDTHILSDNGKNWNFKKKYAYVILDDDSDMLFEHRHNFIKTDTLLGLSDENVKQAIKILNNGEIKD